MSAGAPQQRLSDFGEFGFKLGFDPVGEFGIGRVGGGGADGGVIDAFFGGVTAREAGDDGDVAESD